MSSDSEVFVHRPLSCWTGSLPLEEITKETVLDETTVQGPFSLFLVYYSKHNTSISGTTVSQRWALWIFFFKE
jgi:hypothetical protein